MIYMILVIILIFMRKNSRNWKYNSDTRDLLLFFTGIYGERIYIYLDYLLSYIQIEKLLFLLFIYLIITTFTKG